MSTQCFSFSGVTFAFLDAPPSKERPGVSELAEHLAGKTGADYDYPSHHCFSDVVITVPVILRHIVDPRFHVGTDRLNKEASNKAKLHGDALKQGIKEGDIAILAHSQGCNNVMYALKRIKNLKAAEGRTARVIFFDPMLKYTTLEKLMTGNRKLDIKLFIAESWMNVVPNQGLSYHPSFLNFPSSDHFVRVWDTSHGTVDNLETYFNDDTTKVVPTLSRSNYAIYMRRFHKIQRKYGSTPARATRYLLRGGFLEKKLMGLNVKLGREFTRFLKGQKVSLGRKLTIGKNPAWG